MTVYKHFRFVVFLHISAMIATAVLVTIVFQEYNSFFIPIALMALLLGIVISLLRYIEKSNRDLTHFLFAIRQNAYTESYQHNARGRTHEALSAAFNEVLNEFAALNFEKELQYKYLEAINNHINVGILSFDEEGMLLNANPAAKRLLHPHIIRKLQDFQKINPKIFESVSIAEPDKRQVERTFINDREVYLSLLRKDIVLHQKKVRVLLLQNLNHELESKEIEAWYQLIRVLTHEIMNSVTPIISLSTAARTILQTNEKALSKDQMDDVLASIETVESRSKGLSRFVSAYKNYARPISLQLQPENIKGLITRSLKVLEMDFKERKITIATTFEKENVTKRMDVSLMEQVIINLLKNAMEAIPAEVQGTISIKTSEQNTITLIEISDNGSGMDGETINNIFIPFYTTKPSGSGIGLSLSRQIIKLHQGNIFVKSAPGIGSTFSIELP